MAMAESGKRTMCGILGILLGGFGVHRFMMGDTTGGIIRIVITGVTCGAGGIIGLIEGIMYLMKTDEEFDQMYPEKGWF
mgnify:CR=1 FL=1